MKIDSLLSPGLLKSGLRRFWPLWLAGFAVLFLSIDLPVYTAASQIVRSSGSMSDHAQSLRSMWSIMRFEGWFYALVGAIVVACALNDHLFDSRSATFVGSLPANRSQVFCSVLVAGVAVLVGLPFFAALLMLPLRLMLGPAFAMGGVLQWFATTAALGCVFYAFALLACQLSGTYAVALLLYLVMNWLVVCLELAARMVVSSLMYGVGLGEFVLSRFSPAFQLAQAATGWAAEGDNMVQWGPIALYLLVALIVLEAARVIYARRNLESAGDSVSFVQIRPVLKYLAGISMSLLFGFVYRALLLIDMTEGLPMSDFEVIVLALMMVAGAFLGVLFAEMIMRRSAHVLAKVWRGAAVLACTALVLVGACRFDVFGAVSRVPDPAQVEKVTLDCDFYADAFAVSSPEGVSAACDLHRELIAYDGGDRSDLSSFTIGMVYQLKDGTKIVRSYPVLSDYFEYRTGERSADRGALLIDEFAEIANSREGRASRYASVLEMDPSDYVVEVEYQLSSGVNTSMELPLDERASFLDNALKPDLMDEAAGDVFIGATDVAGVSYDVTVSVLEPLDEYGNGYKVLLNIWTGEESTPNTVAWLHEHHPEIELNTWELTEKY